MKERDKNCRFTEKMFHRALAPCMVSALGMAFSDMADAIVVGAKMGETGLAAVCLSLPVYMVNNFFIHGFGSGGSVRFSRLLAEGREEEAGRSFSAVMWTAWAVSLILLVLGTVFGRELLALLGTTPEDGELYEAGRDYVRVIVGGSPLFFTSYILQYYLRNDDSQSLANLGFTIGNISDIVLNVVLVLVFHMGTAGAAWATVLGQAVSLCVFVAGLWGRRERHHLPMRWMPLPLSLVFSCFRTGAATSVQYLFQMLFLLIANNTLMRVSGGTGVAVFDLVQNASYLVFYQYEGVARAVQPLISTFAGEHNHESRRKAVRLALFWGNLTGGAAILVLVFLPALVCRGFGLQEGKAMELGIYALRVFSIGAVFGGMNILTEQFYQACEKEQAAFVIALLRGAAVLLPFTILFSCFGVEWFWWLYPAAESVSLLIFFIWKKKRGVLMDDFDERRTYNAVIKGESSKVSQMTEELEGFCVRFGADMRQTMFAVMAAEEICLSTMQNGFPEGEGYIEVTMVACPNGEFELHIRDTAEFFDPFSQEAAPVAEGKQESLDAIGIYVIQKKAKGFFYRRYQGFNTTVIRM